MEAIQNLLQQLTRMQWPDYLDIAVVAPLLYNILPLITTPQHHPDCQGRGGGAGDRMADK